MQQPILLHHLLKLYLLRLLLNFLNIFCFYFFLIYQNHVYLLNSTNIEHHAQQYYTLSKTDKDDKNKEIIKKIKEIFINNKERYGYRRITLELRNQGYNVNHKKVYRIMVKLGLKPLKRNKRKYSSYKGTVGKIADNLIERDFNADKPNKKWYTDVTEFNLRGEKCYLSPILDGYNGEVISYNTSNHLI